MKQFGIAALALLFAGKLSAASLAQEIERLIDAKPATRNAFWGIEIVDLASGKTLYTHNAERLFVPASNAKLFTAALTLDRLGPDFRFHTRVVADMAPDADGAIPGAIRLVGGGDPNLSSRAVPYQIGPVTGNPLGPIEDLADQLVARGVKRIGGGIIGDDSRYVWEPYPDGWAIDDTRYEYGAPVSALTVNDNTLTITVRPGAKPGDVAEISIAPAIEYYELDNRITTVAAGGTRKLELDRPPGSRQVRLWGTIPLHSAEDPLVLAIDDPAEFAARALAKALEDRGILVEGSMRSRHRYANEAEDSPEAEGVELARRDSAPLIDDLSITAKVSQNLHAELALRAVARERRKIGSRKAGLEEMKAFLGEIGIAREGYSLGDGSGLDSADLVTPEAIIKLLRHMYDSPLREPWIALMPIGGVDGTLIRRFADNPAGRRIHAKTGTLTHVAALSGYAQRKGGSWVAFAILVNNHNGPGSEAGGVIDRICTLILE